MPGPKKKIDYNAEIQKVDEKITEHTKAIADLRDLRKQHIKNAIKAEEDAIHDEIKKSGFKAAEVRDILNKAKAEMGATVEKVVDASKKVVTGKKPATKK